MGVVEDVLRMKNYDLELMEGWREKARKLAQTPVFLAHIYYSYKKKLCDNTLQELYDKPKC